MLALAPLSLAPTLTQGAWATTPLVPRLELPARVLVGRFGGPALRVVAVSDHPGGAGRRDVCVELSANALVPCP